MHGLLERGLYQTKMVQFTDLSNLSQNATIGDFMAFPNASYPYFWAWIIGAIWVIITLTLFFTEKDKIGKAEILSNLAISSFACIVLSIFGTLLGIIENEIMIRILVLGIVFIVVWLFSSK